MLVDLAALVLGEQPLIEEDAIVDRDLAEVMDLRRRDDELELLHWEPQVLRHMPCVVGDARRVLEGVGIAALERVRERNERVLCLRPQLGVQSEALIEHPNQERKVEQRPGALDVGARKEGAQRCHRQIQDPAALQGESPGPEEPGPMDGVNAAREEAVADEEHEGRGCVGGCTRDEAVAGAGLQRGEGQAGKTADHGELPRVEGDSRRRLATDQRVRNQASPRCHQSSEARAEENSCGEVGDKAERHLPLAREGHGQRLGKRDEGDEQQESGQAVRRETGQRQ